MSDPNTYTPAEDVKGTTPDGREYLIAPKGVPVVMAEARRLGLVKDAQQVAPSETKDAPAETPAEEQTPKQRAARKE